MIKRVEEISGDITQLYHKGIERGEYLGFLSLKDIMSFRLGYPVYGCGAPFSGKTEFMFEILINLSKLKGWKHAIFTPETGTAQEVASELIKKVVQKDFFNTYGNQMSEAERMEAEMWVNEHFWIIDEDESPEFYSLFTMVEDYERLNGIKFQTLLIDPFNECKHEKHGKRDDEYLDEALTFVRINGQKNKRCNIILTHARDQQAEFFDYDGIKTKYYPAPTAREWANGQVWFRKGFLMFAVWRPPLGMVVGGEQVQSNETHIILQKQKPKGIAIASPDRPDRARLYFDWKKHRYYELVKDQRSFAGFVENKEFDDEVPF